MPTGRRRQKASSRPRPPGRRGDAEVALDTPLAAAGPPPGDPPMATSRAAPPPGRHPPTPAAAAAAPSSASAAPPPSAGVRRPIRQKVRECSRLAGASPQDRQAMINSMVERLAARLEQQPERCRDGCTSARALLHRAEPAGQGSRRLCLRFSGCGPTTSAWRQGYAEVAHHRGGRRRDRAAGRSHRPLPPDPVGRAEEPDGAVVCRHRRGRCRPQGPFRAAICGRNSLPNCRQTPPGERRSNSASPR